MASITREQIQKINAKCKNGWELDLSYFLYHSEKTLIKHIKLDDEHYIQFKLNYNYKNQICLYFNKFYHKIGDDFATSNGLGKSTILIEKSFERKMLKNLIDITNILNDDDLIKINAETQVIKSPLFVASEEF